MLIKYCFMQALQLEDTLVTETVKAPARAPEAMQQLALLLVLRWLKTVAGPCKSQGR